MDIETLREEVLKLGEVEEGFPFGEDTLVFKTNNKMFMLISLNSNPLQFNVKCEPGRAVELREEYPETILPGYHMNKKHWNTIIVNGSLAGKMLLQMIRDSYQLVKGKKK